MIVDLKRHFVQDANLIKYFAICRFSAQTGTKILHFMPARRPRACRRRQRWRERDDRSPRARCACREWLSGCRPCRSCFRPFASHIQGVREAKLVSFLFLVQQISANAPFSPTKTGASCAIPRALRRAALWRVEFARNYFLLSRRKVLLSQ